MPLTLPVAEPIVAIVASLLLHEPLEVVSVSVVVNPSHTEVVPPIEAGSGLTVIVVVAAQPVASV